MSANKYLPHILVLPEDDANRQLANGFLLELDSSVLTRIQILPEVGGWVKLLDLFHSDYIVNMRRYPRRHMILLIDLDGHKERLNRAQDGVPDNLRDRVFVLGCITAPEALRSAGLGDYESIGRQIASDCRGDIDTTWEHHLLHHNLSEIRRLREHVRPILFQASTLD